MSSAVLNEFACYSPIDSTSVKPTVLVVDDNPVNLSLLTQILEEEYSVIAEADSSQVMTIIAKTSVDLIVLDLMMPQVNGLEVCKSIRKGTKANATPIIFVTACDDETSEDDCWNAGASDFIISPVRKLTLLNRVKYQLALQEHNKALQEQIYIDSLTGLYNRRYLMEAMTRALLQAQRDTTQLTVIMLDIDYFKEFNDHYGHIEGDECLIKVAQTIKESLRRPSDIACRFGGEEFVCVLPDTNKQGALEVATRVVSHIASLHITNQGSPLDYVTISAGVAFWTPEVLNTNDVLRKADNQLYQAKRSGRNKVSAQDA